MTLTNSRRTGIMLVALSAVFWSTAGLFVRMAHLDAWTILVWRSVFSVLTLGGIVLVQNRGNTFRAITGIGWPGIVSVAISTISSISYVVSLRLTSVANVMTVYAALPFIATAIAYLWLGERVTKRFLVAGAIGLAGIVIMAGGVATGRDLLGIVVALVMTTTFAAQLVYTKRHPALDMTVISAAAAAACIPLSLPLMQAGIPAPVSLLACALYGVLTTGLAYVLVLKGGRLISSGEAGFISMLDVVLGPLWVWLFYAERPTSTVLIGGFAVLGSVLWYLATDRGAKAATVLTEA